MLSGGLRPRDPSWTPLRRTVSRSSRRGLRGSRRLAQLGLPVRGYPTGRPGYRLVCRVAFRLGQRRPLQVAGRPVVPEPVLARLEAADDGGPGLAEMRRRMRRRRVVAAADMSTLRTPAQVQPPPAARVTLDATGTARRDRRVDPR